MFDNKNKNKKNWGKINISYKKRGGENNGGRIQEKDSYLNFFFYPK